MDGKIQVSFAVDGTLLLTSLSVVKALLEVSLPLTVWFNGDSCLVETLSLFVLLDISSYLSVHVPPL